MQLGRDDHKLNGAEQRYAVDTARALIRAAAAMIHADTPVTLRGMLEKALQEVIPFDTLILLTLDAGATVLHRFADSGTNTEEAPQSIPVKGTPWEDIVQERRSLLLKADENAALTIMPEEEGKEAGCAIQVPILSDDELLGFISVESGESERYTREDLQVVEGLAPLVAAALINQRIGKKRCEVERAQTIWESRFRAMFDQFPHGVQISDPGGNTLETNSNWRELFRLTREHIPQLNLLSDPQFETIREFISRGFNGEAITIPAHPYRFDGRAGGDLQPRWLEISISPVSESGGGIREVIVLYRDVTEQKETQGVLRERERQLREAQHLARIGSWNWEVGSERVSWSDEMFRIYGLIPAGEVTFEEFIRRVHPDDRAMMLETIERAREEGKAFELRHRIIRPNGTVHVLHARGNVVVGFDRTVRRLYGTGQDITDQVEVEQALRASADSYRTIFELASDAIFVHDIETGAILDANKKACELSGCTLEQLKEQGLARLSCDCAPYDIEHALAYIRRAANGEPQRFEWLVREVEGEQVWVEVSLHRVNILGEARVLASVRNIGERKAAEAALVHARGELEQRVEERTAELVQAEQRFRAIVEASPTPLLLSRISDGVVLYANDRLEALIGADPGTLVGKRTPDFYYDLSDRPQVIQTVQKQGYVRDLELRIKRQDGTPRWVSLSIQRLIFNGEPALASALIDITERKHAEEELHQRTQELEAIFKALPDLFFRLADDGTILDYRSGRTLGLYVPPEVFLGQKVQDVLPPPVGPQIAEALQEVARTQDLVHLEYMLPLGDEPLEFESRMIPMSEGQIVAVVREVTERKRNERALRASEESYRSLFDSLTELVYIQDLEGRFVNVNEAVVRTYGYTREELIGRTPDFLVAPGRVDLEKTFAQFQKAIEGEPQRFDWWGLRKDGSVFPKEVVLKRSTYFGQDVIIAVARDVTDRVLGEEALRKREEYYRRLIENLSDIIAIVDLEGRLMYASPSTERILGYPLEERIGNPPNDLLHPEDASALNTIFARLQVRPDESERFEFRFRHKDGSWRILEGILRTLTEGEAVTGIVINARDITERKHAEEAVRMQKTLLEAQGEASIDGILVISGEGKILSYNHRFVEMWDIPQEVVESRSDELAVQAVLEKLQDPQDFVDRVAYLYAHPDEVALDEIWLRDGRVFDRYTAPVKSSQGDNYGRIWFFRDMTSQKRHAEELEQARQEAERAREQASRYADSLERSLQELRATQVHLIQQEKMASLGQLTAGIAHEIKNPLNFVYNFAVLSRELIDELHQELKNNPGYHLADVIEVLDDIAFNISKIQEHGQRADGIVRSMLEHSRGTKGGRQVTELNTMIEEYVNLAYHGMRAQTPGLKVEVEREYGEQVGEVEVVPQELGRVLVNLLNNAFYAVHERVLQGDASYVPRVKVHTRRDYGRVRIRVEDNGPGIPEEVREKIFDPFFTTKPPGEGTGLGLSLAYDIITQGHDGTLVVNSQVGQGTTFTITLPTTSSQE